MSKQPPVKKQKVLPSGPPRNRNQQVVSGDQSRSQSLPRPELDPNATKKTRPRSTSLYPTPMSERKSNYVSASSGESRLPAPTFTSNEGDIAGIVAPESGEESDDEDEPKTESAGTDSESSSESDSEDDAGKSKNPIELPSSSPPRKRKSAKRLSTPEIEEKMAHFKAELDRRNRAPSVTTSAKPSPVFVSMSSSKRGKKVTVKIEEGVSSVVEEDPGTKRQNEALSRIVGAYTRDIILRMCGLDHANSVNIELLHDQDGVPQYWDANGKLRPHYNRPLDENFGAWGTQFFEIAMDSSRMPANHQPFLKTVSKDQFYSSLAVTFQSMVNSYNAQKKDGDPEAAKEIAAARARRSGRKRDKAVRRTTALEGTGIDIKDVPFLGHPGYQSSEVSDEERPSVRVVLDPQHRNQTIRQFLDVLDSKYNNNKPKGGNKKVTMREYLSTNTAVPALAQSRNYSATSVPKWAVSTEWTEANSSLAADSWSRIEATATDMPYAKQINGLIKLFRLEPRAYVYSLPPSKSVSLLSRSSALAPAPEQVGNSPTASLVDIPPSPTTSPAITQPIQYPQPPAVPDQSLPPAPALHFAPNPVALDPSLAHATIPTPNRETGFAPAPEQPCRTMGLGHPDGYPGHSPADRQGYSQDPHHGHYAYSPNVHMSTNETSYYPPIVPNGQHPPMPPPPMMTDSNVGVPVDNPPKRRGRPPKDRSVVGVDAGLEKPKEKKKKEKKEKREKKEKPKKDKPKEKMEDEDELPGPAVASSSRVVDVGNVKKLTLKMRGG